MSAFMKTWVPMAHQAQIAVETFMAEIQEWENLENYPKLVKEFIRLAGIDKKLRKQTIGAKRNAKLDIKDQQTKNFNQMKKVYHLLKGLLESGFYSPETEDFERFERALLTYLKHWSARLRVEKPNVGMTATNKEYKKHTNSSIRRFKQERQAKWNRQHASENDFVVEKLQEELVA